MEADLGAIILRELEVECKVVGELGDKRRVILENSDDAHRVRTWLISRGHPVGSVEFFGVLCKKYSVIFDSL